MLPRVFDMFAQERQGIDRSQGGLGLGLAIVRSLLAMHGGRVEARSDGPGRGSEFVVRLPRAEREAKAAVFKPKPRLAEPPTGLHILVVEDNLDGRESLRDLLEIWGHRVSLAESGPAGVEMAFSLPPDVALIDIGLPGIDGNEVARRIRSILGEEAISLIAMTGYGQPEDRRRALQAGFDFYLIKPVDPGVLSRLLAEARGMARETAGASSG
jgi:CheY-like chemotaxis protein